MDTTVRANCPQCRSVLRIPSEWLGRTVKCKKCRAHVRSEAQDQGRDADSPQWDRRIRAARPDRAQSWQVRPRPRRASRPIRSRFRPSPARPRSMARPPAPRLSLPGSPGLSPCTATGLPRAGRLCAAGLPLRPTARLSLPDSAAPATVRRSACRAAIGTHRTRADAEYAFRGRRRYRRGKSGGKLIAVAFCLLLAGGLIGGGIMLMDHLNQQNAQHDEGDGKTDPKTDGKTNGTATVQKTGPYPRRLLFISISKYMYLNPLTATKDGDDQSKPAAHASPSTGTSPAKRTTTRSSSSPIRRRMPRSRFATC